MMVFTAAPDKCPICACTTFEHVREQWRMGYYQAKEVYLMDIRCVSCQTTYIFAKEKKLI